MNKQLSVENPGARASCGCGTSFAFDEDLLIYMLTYKEIVDNSKLPWLELDIEFPHTEMYEEAKAVKDMFVKHRDSDGDGGYRHKGWRSLCIHGIDAYKTNHFEQYGFSSNKDTPYVGLK